MFRNRFLVLALVTSAVAGCASLSPVVTRNAVDDGAMQVAIHDDQGLIAQAQAVERASRELLLRSTMKGAALGAAAGCGLAAMSGGGSSKCITGALAGGAIGAVAGNAAGKAAIEKRVEIVDLSRIMPAMRSADGEMARLTADMPSVLKAQDAEIAALDKALAEGTVTMDAHAARLAEIRDTRRQLIDALSLTEKQARAARAALISAEDAGQDGLAWYVLRTRALESEAVSAREAITLL